jgi:hypothetical protein
MDLLAALLAGIFVAAFVLSLGYLAACAGAERWLSFKEWWG